MRIAIIGDHEPHRLRQTATIVALDHAAKKIGVKLEAVWLSTAQIQASFGIC